MIFPYVDVTLFIENKTWPSNSSSLLFPLCVLTVFRTGRQNQGSVSGCEITCFKSLVVVTTTLFYLTEYCVLVYMCCFKTNDMIVSYIKKHHCETEKEGR